MASGFALDTCDQLIQIKVALYQRYDILTILSFAQGAHSPQSVFNGGFGNIQLISNVQIGLSVPDALQNPYVSGITMTDQAFQFKDFIDCFIGIEFGHTFYLRGAHHLLLIGIQNRKTR